MSNKDVYITGVAHYLNPYYLDKGGNLPDDSEVKAKLLEVGGQYSARVILPFDNRDDAEEHLNSLGIPTDGMFGQLLKKETDEDGNKIITYKVTRPHLVPAFDNPEIGHPRVVNASGEVWDKDVYIGNGSNITVKVNVWKGTKITKLRWEAVRIDNLVEYVAPEGSF